MRNIITFALLAVLFGCSPRVIREVETVTRVECDTITRVVRVPVEIQVPREVHTAIADSVSYLETSVAESTASIDSLGRLHHSLRNKAAALRDTVFIVDTVFRFRETINSSTIDHEIEQLPWYDKLFSLIGRFAIFALITITLCLLIRRFPLR